MTRVLDLWKSTSRLPQGQRIFSVLFAQKAPYFASITCASPRSARTAPSW